MKNLREAAPKSHWYEWYHNDQTDTIRIPTHKAYISRSLQGPDTGEYGYVLIDESKGKFGYIVLWEKNFETFRKKCNELLSKIQ